MALLVEGGQVAPHHHLDDEFGCHLVPQDGADIGAVAQHRHAVAELVDLGHAVGDVDDGQAVAAQLAHDLEELLGLAGRQRRGGLVHDEDARLGMHGAGDLDHLLFGDGQRADQRRRREGRPEALQHAFGAPQHGAAVDQPTPARFAVEVDVLRHRQVRRQRQLLVDDGHARGPRLDGAAGLERHAAHPDLAAGVGLVGARQGLHEGRLAGAVLAHQGMDLARVDGEVDVRQRLDARKRLRDVAHLEDRHAIRGAGSRLCHSSSPDASRLALSEAVAGLCETEPRIVNRDREAGAAVHRRSRHPPVRVGESGLPRGRMPLTIAPATSGPPRPAPGRHPARPAAPRVAFAPRFGHGRRRQRWRRPRGPTLDPQTLDRQTLAPRPSPPGPRPRRPM